MIAFIFKALKSFRPVFPRYTSWLIFSLVVLGFLGAADMFGVSSFCRFFCLAENGYHSLLHFFRSAGWSVAVLFMYWETFVFSQNMIIRVNGRAVLIGDHTYVPKDGRRMPGVVTLRQNSETQTKPSYFRGHCRGAVGVLIGTLTAPFCLPLNLSLHQGRVHIGENPKQEGRLTLGTRIVQTAMDIAVRNDLPCMLILDAYFPSGPVFRLAASVWSVALQQPLITLIIRAKKNFVAYFPAEKTDGAGPGRPPVYGEKVRLMEMFDHLHLFSTVSCTIYGRTEEVRIIALDLLWKPARALLRFVFAITSRGPIVLMGSDLTVCPVTALELYCSRIRIESMFDMLKNLIGAFRYRFWTKKLGASSRKQNKNRKLSSPASESLPTIRRCWEAYERFAVIGAVSIGLLQIIALKYTDSVWSRFDGFLRTRSRAVPSERTVRFVVADMLTSNYRSLAPTGILREIRDRFRRKNAPTADI